MAGGYKEVCTFPKIIKPKMNVASPRLKNLVCPTGGRIIGFIPFPRVLVLCEMQSARSPCQYSATITITPRAPPLNNNKDEDKSPKTLKDKNHQASSQKF